MRSPRPSYGRVSGIYDPQGSTRYGRLGSPTGGQTCHNSYRNALLAFTSLTPTVYVHAFHSPHHNAHISPLTTQPTMPPKRGRSGGGGGGRSMRCRTSQGRDASTSGLRPLWNAAAATVSAMMALPTTPSSPAIDLNAPRPSLGTMARHLWLTMPQQQVTDPGAPPTRVSWPSTTPTWHTTSSTENEEDEDGAKMRAKLVKLNPSTVVPCGEMDLQPCVSLVKSRKALNKSRKPPSLQKLRTRVLTADNHGRVKLKGGWEETHEEDTAWSKAPSARTTNPILIGGLGTRDSEWHLRRGHP